MKQSIHIIRCENFALGSSLGDLMLEVDQRWVDQQISTMTSIIFSLKNPTASPSFRQSMIWGVEKITSKTQGIYRFHDHSQPGEPGSL